MTLVTSREYPWHARGNILAHKGKIAESGISVRETERLIKKKRVPAAETPSASAKKDANIASAEVKLQRKFGTKVNISQNTKGSGKIEIEFYANDDLIRIYQMLIEQ